MQTATKNLIDQLSAATAVNGDVYVSIVPFAKDVNAGASNYLSPDRPNIYLRIKNLAAYHTDNTQIYRGYTQITATSADRKSVV